MWALFWLFHLVYCKAWKAQEPPESLPSSVSSLIEVTRVLSNTPHLPVQWQYTKPAQINIGTDTDVVPASKIAVIYLRQVLQVD